MAKRAKAGATNGDAGSFGTLESNRVHRRLPWAMRAQLNARLLAGADDEAAIRQAFEELKLAEKYGVAAEEVGEYWQAVKQFARPVLAAAAVASLLAALPPSVAQKLRRANELLIWSRLVQSMTDPASEPLSASEFARLAALLKPARAAGGRPQSGTRRSSGTDAAATTERDVREAARLLYGLHLSGDAV